MCLFILTESTTTDKTGSEQAVDQTILTLVRRKLAKPNLDRDLGCSRKVPKKKFFSDHTSLMKNITRLRKDKEDLTAPTHKTNLYNTGKIITVTNLMLKKKVRFPLQHNHPS